MSQTPGDRPPGEDGFDLASVDQGAVPPERPEEIVMPPNEVPPDRPALEGPPTPGTPGRYREITVAAIVVGVLIGLLMNASITYAGLKIGFTLAGSAIAAVLGFGILKAFGRGSIVETNITQTIASAVNTSNSGIIFTFPVLFLLGFSFTWVDLDFWRIALAAVAGAVLGTAFIIPLRKQLIDIDRLRFPTGTGVATILKSPGAGPKKAVVLLVGMLLSALLYAPAGLPGIDTFELSAESREKLEEKLDELLKRERVTPEGKQRTLAIHDLIQSQDPPEELVRRGEVAAELSRAKGDLEQARKDKLEASRSNDEAAAAEAATRADELRARVKELEQQLEELSGDDPLFGNEFAERVYQITEAPTPEDGERPSWESLRDTKLGWAAARPWGYQDLNWRLPAHYKKDSDELVDAHDHDDDGRPDQIITDSKFYFSRLIGLPDQFELIFGLAPFALGAGFITGRPGLLVLAGGILAYFVINPVAYSMGWLPQTVTAYEAPDFMFGAVNRPLGIGMLVGGAAMGVLVALPSIGAALKSMAAPKAGGGRRDELGFGVLIPVILVGAGLLFVAADYVGQSPINTACPITEPAGEVEIDPTIEPATYEGYSIGFATEQAAETWRTDWTDAQRDGYLSTLNARPGLLAAMDPHLRAAIISLIGVVWIWFAGVVIAQCTGLTDWSPISGLALLTVVIVLLLAGTGAVLGAVLLGAALCVAITLAADMMSDLKTGYLIGSRPAAQQKVELGLVWIGPAVSMLVVLLIVAGNQAQEGVPLGPGTDVPAPQAQALEAIIKGVQGGDLPYALYIAGAALGVVLGFGSFAGLGVLVGLSVYLPFYYIATYGLGCIANIALTATKGRRFVEEWGVPMAAGFIVGEGILALLINIFVLSQG